MKPGWVFKKCHMKTQKIHHTKGMGDFDSTPGNKSLQYFECLAGDSPERERDITGE